MALSVARRRALLGWKVDAPSTACFFPCSFEGAACFRFLEMRLFRDFGESPNGGPFLTGDREVGGELRASQKQASAKTEVVLGFKGAVERFRR